MRKSKHQRTVSAVSSYFPDLLLQEMASPKSFGPSRIVSLSGGLLQADASGFTKMSEGLSRIGRKGAEELTQMFNRFFASMLRIVFAHQGDVLKFGGDSLLVFFRGERGGHRAVATALEMQKRMKSFRSVSTSSGIFALALHVGINTGDFFALSLGDPGEKLELAILGKKVNVTIRCNEAAGPGEILLTQSCYRGLKDMVRVSERRGPWYKLAGLSRKPKTRPRPSCARIKSGDPDQLLKALVPYLPQGIYQKIEADPDKSLVESEHRRITVLFLNLIYSEKLLKNIAAWKRETLLMVNDHFKIVQKAVADCGGVIARIDPYSLGDKVLVLFGAPVAQEDDEERAILCALEMKEKLELSEAYLRHLIKSRIGINTGNAFCGEVGSRNRKEYTVMGKDVNLAARLMSKAGAGQIFVSERTFRAAFSKLKASELMVEAKGIAQPLRVFNIEEVVKQHAAVTRRGKDERAQTPLIGREPEIRQISNMVAQVIDGRGQIISIVGEPGIGKSRLTEELLNLCAEKKMNGMLVDCHFYSSNTPLLPWIEILKNYCGIVDYDDSKETERKLTLALKKIDSARWAPLFNDHLGLSIGENEWTSSLDGKTRRQILFDTIVSLTLERNKGPATHLIFEDAHWIDQTSLDLLLYFSRRISNHPILVVLAHRPELRAKELEGLGNYEKILLGELSKEDAFSLASFHLRLARLPHQMGKLIWEKSRGNPLYVQELIRSLDESGFLIWNEGKRRYELSCASSKIEIPDTVQDVIMARIDKLDEIGRKVMKTASVIGRVFSFESLAAILPYALSEIKLRSCLEHLSKLDLLPLKDTKPNLQYAFKHALTQEVAYSLLPFTQKQSLHLKIGGYYEKKFKNSLEERCELLAHHYENSPDLGKAFTYLVKAGNKGKRVYSSQEAIRFFDRAEKIYRQDLLAKKQKRQIKRGSSLMSELLEQRGEVYKLIGEYSQAEKDFLALLNLAKRARSGIRQSKPLNLLGELCWLRSDYPASQTYVEEGYRISLSHKDDLGLAMCYNNFGDICRRQGSFEKASENYQSALRHYKVVEDNEGIARSYNNIGISNWSLGSLTEAAKYFERSLRVRREAKDKVGEAKTSNNLALIYQDRGDLSRALHMLDNALKIFRRIGDKRNSGYCLGNMGTIYKSQARFSAALKAFQESVQIFSDIGDEHALTYSIGNIGDVQLKIGNSVEARERYDQTLTTARRLGDEELESETLSRFGTYHLLLYELEESESYFKKALALAKKIKSSEFIMKALAGLTELKLQMVRYPDALKSSQELLTLAQRENMREYGARGHLLRGMAKAVLRPGHEAESDLKKAQEISTEVGLPEILYKVHLQLAKLLDSSSQIEGKKPLIAVEAQLTQAKKILESIASHIEELADKEVFLNSRLAELRLSGKEVSIARA